MSGYVAVRRRLVALEDRQLVAIAHETAIRHGLDRAEEDELLDAVRRDVARLRAGLPLPTHAEVLDGHLARHGLALSETERAAMLAGMKGDR